MTNALTGYYGGNVAGQNALANVGQGYAVPSAPDWADPTLWNKIYQGASPFVNSPNIDMTQLQAAGLAVPPGIQRSWASLSPQERLNMLVTANARQQDPNAPRSTAGAVLETTARTLPLVMGGLGAAGVGFLGGAGAAAGAGAGLADITVPSAGSYLPAIGASAGGIGAVGAGLGGAAASSGAAAGASGMGLGISDWLNIGNTVLGAVSSNRAANVQQGASQDAIAELRRQYDTTRADQAPYQAAGVKALGNLSDPNANFMASPDYAFRRSEGQRDIGNSFAARGGAFSGNALRALDQYNQSLASGEFGNWWNRQAGLAGVGQTANAQTGAFGQNTANNVANNIVGAGDARASGIQNTAAILGGGARNFVGNYLYRNAPYQPYGGYSPYQGYGG